MLFYRMMKEIPQNIPHAFLVTHTSRILHSYQKWTGKNLISTELVPKKSAMALFYAPFVVVSSTADSDPILNYGNQKALDLWEMSWETLTRTPGRHTAEPMHRDERQKFLEQVQKNGFIENYSGIRISSTGKRFKIEKATVWNLIDEAGHFYGQAATFSNWRFL